MTKLKDSGSDAFMIKDFFLKIFSIKYYYLACIIIAFAFIALYNKLSSTVYEVKSVIGPVDFGQSNVLAGSNSLFTGFSPFSETRNLENDIASLNSFGLVENTLHKLNLEIGYFREGSKLGKPEQVYPSSPIRVIIDKSHIQPVNARFYIDIIDENTFRLRCSEEKIRLYNYIDNEVAKKDVPINLNGIFKFNETISNPEYHFSVSLNKEYYNAKSKDESLFFEFYHLDELTAQYLKRLKIEPVNLKASLINISFQGENLELTIDFLNNYIETYLNDNLAKKNKISVNTINFIESQISEISDSLVLSESQLKDYRSANQVTNLSYQGQQALEQMTQLETEKSTLQIQERYYNYILDYFNKNKDMAGLAPPSVANVVDPIMNQLIIDLLALNAERSNILANNADKNLFLGQLENKIKLQKQAIVENVTNNLNTLILTKNEINYRAEKLNYEISKLPRTELNLVSMQRKFNLSDAIYTYLLQKRAESAITMASNYPDYEILEPARSITRKIISPRTMVNYIIGLILALLIPTLVLIIKGFFNEKISSITDIQQITERNVVGTIFRNLHKTESVVSEFPGSSVSESFRNLRSNLFIKLRSDKSKIILVTSAQPQDGKSFVSFNLAASIASVGYKTIIVDCDLRRPTLHKKLKIENKKGLSNLITNHTSKDEVIMNSRIPNLSFIPAGPLLPNPTESLESGKLDSLIVQLKTQYDYVILDATPAGIVADAMFLLKYATEILVVCRNNYTRKDLLTDVLDLLKNNKAENVDIIFNDMNLKDSHLGRYNSYYRHAN